MVFPNFLSKRYEFCINLNGQSGQKFPGASKILSIKTYVDDILTGATSIEKLLHQQENIIGLLFGGGFKLKKRTNNCPQLL